MTKKTILVALLALTPSAAFSQEISCYDSVRYPEVCTVLNVSKLYPIAQQNVDFYGYAVGAVATELYFQIGEKNRCVQNSNASQGQATTLGGQLASCNGLISSGQDELRRSKALSTRLRRVCGSKCRQIK